MSMESVTIEISTTEVTVDPLVTQTMTVEVKQAGPQGLKGDATAIYEGSGVPASGLGITGDFYIDSDNGNWYGPKTSDILWPASSFTLKGDQGIPGINGSTIYTGTTVPALELGDDGDYYFRTDTGDWYGPKAIGWGSPVGNLTGPIGPTGEGVEPGGTIGQILVKQSATDYDMAWEDAGAGDMIKTVYDPQLKQADAFKHENHDGVYIDLETGAAAPTRQEGRFYYDKVNKCLSMFNDDGEFTWQVGREVPLRVWNASLTDTLLPGRAVAAVDVGIPAGDTEPVPFIAYSSSNFGLGLSRFTIGILTSTAEPESYAEVTVIGMVRDIDTSLQTAGAIAWLAPSDPADGTMQDAEPASPDYAVEMGGVVVSNALTGKIFATMLPRGNKQDIDKFYNGAILEDHTVNVTSNGTTITATLDNGGDSLSMFFDAEFYQIAIPATVALTAGTNAIPVLNYVYIPEATKVLTASTTGFPSSGQYIPVATVLCQSAASVQTDEVYKLHAWTDHLATSQEQGHLADLNRWIRTQNATWIEGVANTYTGSGTTTVNIATTSVGKVLQLHEHNFPIFASPAPFYVINDFTTKYVKQTNLASILTDSEGGTFSARSFALVLWGAVSENDNQCKLFMNVPLGSYTSASLAAADAQKYTDYSIPPEYRGTGFLIKRYICSRSPGGAITITDSAGDELRGTFPNNVAGGSSAFGDFDAAGTANQFMEDHTGETAPFTQWDHSTFLTAVPDGGDGTAIHDNEAGEIAAITQKAIPLGADFLLIEDSAAGNAKKALKIEDLPGGANILINEQTGTTYTLVESDAGKLVRQTNTAAITTTIPTNAVVPFALGSVISFEQGSAGALTIQGDVGVTLKGYDNDFTLSGVYAIAGIVKVGTDEWRVFGNTTDSLTLDDTFSMLPTEAEFNARVADNRDRYAGSGFVEWGKHYKADPYYYAINEGIWTDTSSPNILLMGLTTTGLASADCTSKTNSPIANVNGVIHKIQDVSGSTAYGQSKISFPPASAVSTLPERQDLMFLETWHEQVGDKDIVYPFGNVQSLLATDTATGLTTVAGTFSGNTTYSLFGNWQATSALVGKGLVWSTMSEANKKLFIADPENNMYLGANGEIIQVRYRIRVVEGLGADWDSVSPNSDNLRYDLDNRVLVKGKRTSVSDFGTYLGNDTYNRALPEDLPVEVVGSRGLWKARDEGLVATDAAYQGLCFATPIALVSRRNQGAFHPVWNPQGTKYFGTGQSWYASASLALGISSTADCFDEVNYVWPNAGYISSTNSQSPDEKFYDAIYEGDVQDLRNSAHKQDLKRTLERELNKMVGGTFRGWEKPSSIRANVAYSWSSSDLATFGIGLATLIRTTTASTDEPTGTTTIQTLKTIAYIEGDSGQWYKCVSLFASTGLRSYVLHPQYGDVRADFATAGAISIVHLDDIQPEDKEILWCDIIGNPANYPAEWKTNGVMGNALLVGEEGTSYVDNGTQIVKMSRKVSGGALLLVLFSDDAGATWGTASLTFDETTNSRASTLTTSPRIYMIFYNTEASPFELASNAEVLGLHKASGFTTKYRANLMSALINKVATGANLGDGAQDGHGVKGYENGYSNRLSANAGQEPQHDSFQGLLHSTSPGIKVLPYLTREDGKLFLQALYKEMKFDTDYDSGADTAFIDRADADTSLTVVNSYYHVTDGTFQGYYRCLIATTVSFSSPTWGRDSAGNIVWNNGDIYFELWNGNGWGDDNTFNVVTNESTTTDDNANTIILGQKRTELPYFIHDGE